jgi:hypothetical protein
MGLALNGGHHSYKKKASGLGWLASGWNCLGELVEENGQ